MDKRVFVAFIVSIAVAMAYQAFVLRPQQEKKRQELKEYMATHPQEQQVQQPAAPVQTTGQAQPVSTQPQPVPQNLPPAGLTWEKEPQEKEVVLENSKLRATFTNIGAGLKALYIKEKERNDLELVIPQNYALQPLYIDLGLRQIPAEKPIYTVEQVTPSTIKFSLQTDGVVEEKLVTLQPDSFQFDVLYTVKSLSPDVKQFDKGLNLGLGIVKRFSPGDSREEVDAVAYLDVERGKLISQPIIGKKVPKPVDGKIVWGSVKNKYYTLICKPDQRFAGMQFTSFDVGSKTGEHFARLVFPAFSLKPQKELKLKFLVYIGPQTLENLVPFKSDFEKEMYFSGVFGPVNFVLIKSLNWLYSVCRNYGIAIILLTIIIKILFYPLTKKSFSSMKRMQQLQPKIAVLKEKYKDNNQKLQQEIMALYKREKVNPLGGCLPMLIQLPIFFGLYRTLYSAYELIHAKFLWISSLSEADKLFVFSWGGSDFNFNILPLIMGVTMFIQQKMTPGDPQQQKMMMFMPVLFTVMLYNLPSGLVIYWTLSNVLSILQQHYSKS